jgi:hypothetical protein
LFHNCQFENSVKYRLEGNPSQAFNSRDQAIHNHISSYRCRLKAFGFFPEMHSDYY